MNLPQLSEYSEEELESKLAFHQNDRGCLPDIYYKPLSEIIKVINELPPTDRDNKHDYRIRLDNWNGLYGGYDAWGIPDFMEDDPRFEGGAFQQAEMQRRMQMQFWYRNRDDYPEIQLGRILSAPFKKRLKAFGKSQEFASLGQKIYILKVELSPNHTSHKKDPKDRVQEPVICWRLLTCFGDTNLNAFHDQILAPAMGWRRNFHAYKYTVPTNGACIFPNDTSAMDRQHLTFNQPTFCLDTADYDVRHLLRKVGDRLVYTYDMGDNWCHIIKVLAIQDLGTTLYGSDLEDLDKQAFKAVSKKEWVLQGSSLLWGEVNCPPENSEGCGGLGRYGNILKKGRDYEVPEAENIINWKDHDIQYAYDFDLEAHKERFKQANNGRQNSRSGVLAFHHTTSSLGVREMTDNGDPLLGGPAVNCNPFSGGRTNNRKHVTKVNTEDGSVETVRRKTTTKSKCNYCGKVKGSHTGLKLYDCSRCKAACYCSVACQKKDWKKHKQSCTRPAAP